MSEHIIYISADTHLPRKVESKNVKNILHAVFLDYYEIQIKLFINFLVRL